MSQHRAALMRSHQSDSEVARSASSVDRRGDALSGSPSRNSV